jgi:hypothetical protein
MTKTDAKKDAKKKTRIVSPIGMLSFINIATPDVGREFSKGEYKFDLLFPKKTWKEDGKELRTTIILEARKFYGDPNIKSLSQIPYHPIKDGDEKDPEKASSKAYKDMMYVVLRSKYKPEVYKPDGKTMMTPEEVEAVKAGDFARAVMSIWGFKKGNKTGISCGLDGIIQFYKEGKALGGAGKAASVALLSELEVDLDDIDLGEDVGEEEEEDSEEDVANVRL